MSRIPEPINSDVFDAARLMADHPPIWRHPNKRAVFEIACPPGSIHRGTLHYSRWAAMSLPGRTDVGAAARRVEGREGFYDYAPVTRAGGAAEWHVNFADPYLFIGYGSRLFAQDEMQVAEHPVLGALLEALQASGRRALTVERDRPTPVLATGVERRCRVAIDRNAEEGRPRGLYGNEFARADAEAVRRATTRLDPPTITNLIAMAAPSGGQGRYSPRTIEHVLTTAFTGFRAAALESVHHHGAPCPVLVHTGFWGCGAFGGHRVLMAMLQILAAEMAGVERLLFHTGSPGGTDDLKVAVDQLTGKVATTPIVEKHHLIDQVAALGFAWGVSDGN